MQHDHNLLINLFTWRPREDTNPAENFLTEAFVHTLRKNTLFRATLIETLVGRAVNPNSINIDTRASHADDEVGTTIFPDILIKGLFDDDSPFTLVIEVKWGANYVQRQVERYSLIIENETNPFLVFLTARIGDFRRASADKSKFSNVSFRALLWETVYSTLVETAGDCPYSKDFLGFMEHRDLNPGTPISQEMASAFIIAKPIIDRLHRYTDKLLHEFDWSILPDEYRDIGSVRVKNRYGRVAMEFCPSWNGGITIGFLHDNRDHAVAFADGSQSSLDLMMRIEASPNSTGREEILAAIRSNIAEIRQLGGVLRLADDGIPMNGNTLFIVQRSLSDFLVHPTEGMQLEAIYDQVKRWTDAIFRNGKVGDALDHMRDVN